MPGETRAYLVIAGQNVIDLDVWVSLLSPLGYLSVTIQEGVAPGTVPVTDFCTYSVTPTSISAHDGEIGVQHFRWSADKSVMQCTFASGAKLPGTWYIVVTNPSSVAVSASVEASLTSYSGPPSSQPGNVAVAMSPLLVALFALAALVIVL